MAFLNWMLIFGAGLFTIPVIIHLLNRSRFRVVKWGAMHLLEPVVRINRRRVRLEQILLLLVRAMIPIALALCMAAPVLTGCQNLAGNAKSSMVVVLDNSYSMAAGGANANFDDARRHALRALRHVRDGSDASVVLMAGGPATLTDQPTFKTSLLSQQLERLTASYGQADAPASLALGAQTISGMQYPKRDMVIISDFQRVTWEADLADARQRLAQWRDSSAGLLPSITLMRVGRETNDNVAITDVSFSRLIVGVGQKVRIDASLTNFGDQPYPSTRVRLFVNKEERGFTEVTLEPRATAQARFHHTFDEPGSHVVRLVADDVDRTLEADNEYLVSVQVLDRIPALLVDGDPSGEPLRSETAFLSVALQPFEADDAVELADLIQSFVIRDHQLDATALAGMKLVVLANVARLDEAQLRLLEGFVRGGGGLIVFPGNRIDADYYNDTLHAGGAGLLPMRLTELAGGVTDAGRHTSIVTQTYRHPALTLFNDRSNGDLSTGDVWTWYRLADAGGANASRGSSIDAGGGRRAEVMARLATGDPLFVEKKFGEGRVIQCATACDGDWSNLPVRPWYLPLMQQLASHAASAAEPPRNLLVGQTLVAHLPAPPVATPLSGESATALATGGASESATIVDPSGVRHGVAIADHGSRGVVTFKQTQQLGQYTLSAPGSPAMHFVVRSPRHESDLSQLSDEEIDELAAALGADVVSTWDEYAALDQTRRHGYELWHWLWWAVLALLFGELLLQQWFARRV